jgi:hypothetical protein
MEPGSVACEAQLLLNVESLVRGARVTLDRPRVFPLPTPWLREGSAGHACSLLPKVQYDLSSWSAVSGAEAHLGVVKSFEYPVIRL